MTNPIRRRDVVSAIAKGRFEIDAAVRQQLAAYIKGSHAYGQHVEAAQGIVFDLNMGVSVPSRGNGFLNCMVSTQLPTRSSTLHMVWL